MKKVRGKIKTHALRSEDRIAITDRKVAERKLHEWLVWNAKTRRFQPFGRFFQIICQPIWQQILRQLFLWPTEAYTQTLDLRPTDSYVVCS